MRRRTTWLGVGVLVLALAGCSGGNDDSGGSGVAGVGAADPGAVDAGGTAEKAPAAGLPGAAPDAGRGAAPGAAPGAVRATVTLEPQLIRTAKLDVVVDDVSARAAEAGAAARAAGGVVAGDDRSGKDSQARAALVLRVPPARLDALVDRLAGMGTEQQRTSTTEDVTEDVADIGARVATMQASIARVRAILSRADRIGDVVAVEGELSRRVTELESLQARQRALAGRTSYATLSLGLSAQPTVAAAPPVERGGFVGGLQDGWDAFAATVNGLLVVLGAVLPFLVVLVPAGLAARWAVRRSRRAPAAAPPAAP